MDRKKVVIIGGVAGGATTAARLRRLDQDAEIIILEKGDYISYANCGLPYYIGDVIKEREALLLQTPEAMKQRFNIEVRTGNEVLTIQPKEKTVLVKRAADGSQYEESYDVLVIATGSTPIVPPIEGIDGDGIFTLWNIPDTDRIKQYLMEKKPKTAAIIGGGFIGLEMAENLREAGCQVAVIEMQDQVMAPLDFEMAQLVHENMKANGVELILSDGVKKFEQISRVPVPANRVILASGREVEAELIILSIGIKANSGLAKGAGLELNQRGGIVVDEYLKTSDQSIYAVGDAIEVTEFIEKGKTMIPLAGPANKQARICAGNIAVGFGSLEGESEAYEGTQGTSVAKVFDLTVAATGLNEKALIRMGKKAEKDYFTAVISQKSHAGYYPDSTTLTMKLLFAPSGKIFGAQIVGVDGVDKRIDVIATAIRLGATATDLKKLELAYAPPYSSAKDPVNMLGFVSENILKGLVRLVPWDATEHRQETAARAGASAMTLLDVRESFERMAFSPADSVPIPFGQLRDRLEELDRDQLIVTFCAIGVRAYNAARILMNAGFKHVAVYPGGAGFYRSVFHDTLCKEDSGSCRPPFLAQGGEAVTDSGDVRKEAAPDLENVVVTKNLDCSGLQCPGPIMKVFQAVNEVEEGDIIKVSATDMGFAADIESWCRRTGNTLVKKEREGKQNVVYIQKGKPQVCEEFLAGGGELPQGKTMVVFSGDLDKVLASFIIANGAAAMGRPVTMFFTFWGLNALRKQEKQGVKKSLIEGMFGRMMPRGVNRLKLSKMNMGGMGTKMMKKVMADKSVDSLEALMKKAMENGVKLVACTMSMDVMGIRKEELMDGVELGGVAAYLGDAEQANVNLFI